MKAKEINHKSKEELQEILKEKKAKLVQLRFEMTSRQLKDHTQIRRTKKTIARIMTKLKFN
ncbi:MAG: 50S ribosomal protein L29 [Patescibacteria group bacterium]|nr:50S ribosomal protein L29 [Patescibacteria group bacterium]